MTARKPSSKLPKTPEFLDRNVLLRPSLSMIEYAHAELTKKESKANAVCTKARHKCEDCRFYHTDDLFEDGSKMPAFCGLYSCGCVSSVLRPSFLPKEEVKVE